MRSGTEVRYREERPANVHVTATGRQDGYLGYFYEKDDT